ncbi:MAG: [Fe-S]-binding protein [Thermoprotei archaeon]|nr:MAG: [Fe-S]-binding protein [Thermoprotei archaeon]
MRRLVVTDPELCVGCMSCMFACSRRFGVAGLAKSAIYVRSIGGVERGFTVIVCRACKDPPCVVVCPTNALRKRKGGGVIFDCGKCIGCGNCVEACPFGAVQWDFEENKPVICVHCGYCVNYCPHGVLAIEEVGE